MTAGSIGDLPPAGTSLRDAQASPDALGVETASRPPRVVVVGAGIAGLAAALRIAEAARRVDLVVCEAGSRAGGVIATQRDGGYLIEAGPDSFLTEKPEALRLCERLGLAAGLVGVQSGAARAYVVRRGRLVQIPDGFRLVAPTRLLPWLRSPLFSWPGKARMAIDCVLPRGRPAADESVASFVIRRFGREAFERVAQPMIGTIYTGDAAALSLEATMPRLAEVERRYGSVIRGLVRAQEAAKRAEVLRQTGQAAARRPGTGRRLGIFAALADGMQALPDAAVTRLPAGALRLGTAVRTVTRIGDGARYAVALEGGPPLEADAVVIAVHAPAAGRLVAGLDGALASQLSAIAYASSASVTLAYRRDEIRHPLDGLGFVVPQVERRPILAASFASVKFPGRAPAGAVLIRVFLGGALAPEMAALDDDRLVAIVRGELDALLGAAGTPHFVRVHRHREAMPQYVVGHLARVAEIEDRIAGHPGLALAGAAYRGIGIPDCIRSGEDAADQVLAAIRAPKAGDPARREARRPPN
ncbi:MAG TPA: protoporphyrinogen oxidase [bacterium]|nr:protoporphyrinogen oxidase [bacterium]